MSSLQTLDVDNSRTLRIEEIDGATLDRLQNLYLTDVRIRPTRLVALGLLSIFEHGDLTVAELCDLVAKRPSGYVRTVYAMRQQGLLRIKGHIRSEEGRRPEQLIALSQAGAETLADVRHNIGISGDNQNDLNHRVRLHDTLRDEAGLYGVPSLAILMMVEQGVTNATEMARWADVPLAHITRLTHSCRAHGLLRLRGPHAGEALTQNGRRLIELMRTL